MPFPLTLQRAGINQTDKLGEECLEEREKAIGPLRKEAVAGFDRPLFVYFLIPMLYLLMPNATKKFLFLSFIFFPLFLSSLGSHALFENAGDLAFTCCSLTEVSNPCASIHQE